MVARRPPILTYATPLQVATWFALFRCSRDNGKYAVKHGEGTPGNPSRQHRFKLCVKCRDALRRQARPHSGTRANAPAPCFVRVPDLQVEKKRLDSANPRRRHPTEPL